MMIAVEVMVHNFSLALTEVCRSYFKCQGKWRHRVKPTVELQTICATLLLLNSSSPQREHAFVNTSSDCVKASSDFWFCWVPKWKPGLLPTLTTPHLDHWVSSQAGSGLKKKKKNSMRCTILSYWAPLWISDSPALLDLQSMLNSLIL